MKAVKYTVGALALSALIAAVAIFAFPKYDDETNVEAKRQASQIADGKAVVNYGDGTYSVENAQGK